MQKNIGTSFHLVFAACICPANVFSVAIAGVRQTPFVALAPAKVFRHLMPIMWFSALLSYLDRSNLSYAGLQMKEDLQPWFTKQVYGFGAGIFFLACAPRPCDIPALLCCPPGRCRPRFHRVPAALPRGPAWTVDETFSSGLSVLQVHSVRAAVQHDAGPLRRPVLAQPNPRHLGPRRLLRRLHLLHRARTRALAPKRPRRPAAAPCSAAQPAPAPSAASTCSASRSELRRLASTPARRCTSPPSFPARSSGRRTR